MQCHERLPISAPGGPPTVARGFNPWTNAPLIVPVAPKVRPMRRHAVTPLGLRYFLNASQGFPLAALAPPLATVGGPVGAADHHGIPCLTVSSRTRHGRSATGTRRKPTTVIPADAGIQCFRSNPALDS